MQRNLNLFKGRHGGRRPGSERPRQRSPGVSHRSREVVSAKTPLHVNFKYKAFIRNKDSVKLLKKAIHYVLLINRGMRRENTPQLISTPHFFSWKMLWRLLRKFPWKRK